MTGPAAATTHACPMPGPTWPTPEAVKAATAALAKHRARLRKMSQAELEAYIDGESEAGRDSGPLWDATYRAWEKNS